jgi:hypothetical protein
MDLLNRPCGTFDQIGGSPFFSSSDLGKGAVMRSLVCLLLVLGLSVFTIGCGQPSDSPAPGGDDAAPPVIDEGTVEEPAAEEPAAEEPAAEEPAAEEPAAEEPAAEEPPAE